MSEPEKKIEEPKPDASKMAAFSDKRDDLFSALDMLYIYGNASGRNKFREKWPDVALYVFGDMLIKFDNDGADDFELRKQLEEEADARRFFLKETIEDMVDKSVDSGMLQFDYVGKVVDAFGPILSMFLYSETVIERVRPGLLGDAVSVADATAAQAVEEGLSDAERQALTDDVDQSSETSEQATEPLDDVLPIQTEIDKPQDDLSHTETVTLDSDTLDDIVPPESELDDIHDADDVHKETVDALFPEEAEAESAVETVSNPAPSAEEVESNPAPAADAQVEDMVEESNPAPPAVETASNPAPPAEDVASNPAPPVEEVASNPAPPAGELDIPLSKPVEEVSPADVAPAEVPVQNTPAAEIPLDEPKEEVKPVSDDALDEIQPIETAMPLQSSDSQSELSAKEQPQPDVESPKQEALPEEGSQSPEQPEDTQKEQSAENKTDSVSFAGRE